MATKKAAVKNTNGLRKPGKGESLFYHKLKGIFIVREDGLMGNFAANKNLDKAPQTIDGWLPISYEDAVKIEEKKTPPEAK